MRPRKFYFVPLAVKKGKQKSDFFPYVRIQKPGVMCFGQRTLEYLGVEKETSVKLYVDPEKRALGFSFTDVIGKKEDGYRFFVPKKYASGATMGFLGVGSFLNTLKNVSFPSPDRKSVV